MTGEQTADAERDRAERHLALLESCEPLGMVSKPHICVFSDALSISHRDVLALADRLAALVAQHRDTQEALAAADALVDAYGNMVARDGKFYAYMDARAAMPGMLPCGHPESDETTDALGNTICSVCSVAALSAGSGGREPTP